MAMFENLGYCPTNDFLHYEMEEKEIPKIWEDAKRTLGDRTGYMVYDKESCKHDGWCYAVDCLVGCTSYLGFYIAKKLKEMIPVCKYGETGRKILLTDVLDPYKIPGLCFTESDHRYAFSQDLSVREDDRYVVGIRDEGEAVQLYFYRKQK